MPGKRKKKPEPKDLHQLYTELAKGSDRGRIMEEVEEFTSIPTVVHSFNRATTVGGAPLSCVWLIHGPSGGGKTVLTLLLLRSVQLMGGIVAFVDAELAGDTTKWFRYLGVDLSKCYYVGRSAQEPGKKPKQPLSYEEIQTEVNRILDWYQAGKASGEIAPSRPLLIVVDSLSKMVPSEIQKKADKGGRQGVGRLQANMNTEWLIGLGPRVGDDDIIFAAIAHEYTNSSSTGRKPKGWTNYKIRGGDALVYDSMVQLRVTFAGAVRDLSDDSSPIVGRRHRVKVLKNKHGPCFQESIFYTSTGEGVCPIGFDRIRETIHEAMVRGLVPGAKEINLTMGVPVAWKGKRWTLKHFYQGKEGALEALSEIEAELNSGVWDAP